MSPRPTSSSKKPALKTKRTLAHHALQSLLNIAPRTHTGKKVAHKHTSHGVLLVGLLLTGVLLFSNLGVMKAYGISKDGSLNVSANIYGTPPTIGAAITFPTPDSITKLELLEVQGTCPANTLVALYNGGVFAGSTICTATDSFAVTIQLSEGINVLQAQNYDGMNQPGPTTNQIAIEYIKPASEVKPTAPDGTIIEVVTTPEQLTPAPEPIVIPPTPQPGENPCYDSSEDEAPQDNQLRIIVSCIYRNIFAGEVLQLPLRIEGGFAPYALTVEWGDGEQDLFSIVDTKKRTLQHTYKVGGFRTITLKTSDSAGKKSQLQTIVSVNGEQTTGTVGLIPTITETARAIWLEAPVPLYFIALTLVVGFWVGDVFQRFAFHKNLKHVGKLKKA